MSQKNYFNITEHPSDTGLKVVAVSPEKLFEVAALGMFSIMSDIKKIKSIIEKDINIVKDKSFGIEDLLIFWLEELIYYFEVDSMLFSRFEVREIYASDHGNRKTGKIKSDSSSIVSAVAFGEHVDTLKHEICIAIKSPTYHNLSIIKEESSSLWKATVVFDV